MQPMSPQWMPSVSITTTPDRKRGFLLGGFLILSMIVNVVLGAVLVLFAGVVGGVENKSDGLDPAADFALTAVHHSMLFLALLTVFNLIFLTGVWMWKKWGVYGYGSISILGMLVGMRVAPASALTSIAWCGIIGALIASRWRYFE
jgi:hypothetical protein